MLRCLEVTLGPVIWMTGGKDTSDNEHTGQLLRALQAQAPLLQAQTSQARLTPTDAVQGAPPRPALCPFHPTQLDRAPTKAWRSEGNLSVFARSLRNQVKNSDSIMASSECQFILQIPFVPTLLTFIFKGCGYTVTFSMAVWLKSCQLKPDIASHDSLLGGHLQACLC